jgi:uncharacterized protein YndB with AHSA1/START domain
MIKVERTVTVHRPIEEVFAYICEVEHGPSYTSGQREARQTSSGPIGIGSTFATRGKFLRGGATCEVTEFAVNQRLAWKTTSGSQATTTWSLQPSGPSTRMTFTEVTDAYRFVRLPESLLQALANGRVERNLATLKELLAITRKPAAKGW